MARPNKYETEVKEKLILVEGWARDGLTDEQIASNLGIGISTLYEYKNRYTEFTEALKKGKEVVDFEVENALLKAAMDGNTTAQIFWLKNRQPKKWRDRHENEVSGNVGVTNLTVEQAQALLQQYKGDD